MQKEEKQRTIQQNKSLHLMFTELAKALNENGLDIRKVIQPGIEIPWSPESVKEYIWRPVQRAYIGKESTTELCTSDIDKIFEIIVRVIGERCGISLNWPSIELLMNGEKIINVN